MKAVLENLSQFFIVIQQLTEKEWKGLIHRYELATASIGRNLPRNSLNPQRGRIDELSRNLEEWIDGGIRAVIVDDIKVAALEQLVRIELEKHVLLDRSNCTAFEEAIREISVHFGIRRAERETARKERLMS